MDAALNSHKNTVGNGGSRKIFKQERTCIWVGRWKESESEAGVWKLGSKDTVWVQKGTAHFDFFFFLKHPTETTLFQARAF